MSSDPLNSVERGRALFRGELSGALFVGERGVWDRERGAPEDLGRRKTMGTAVGEGRAAGY